MHCAQCHADNPDEASVCLQCGSTLALTCPQCGTELPPQANFCFHCGSPMMAPPTEPDEDSLALLQRAVRRLAQHENLVTNGPFLVESWEPRRSLTLGRNPCYPGSVGGNLQRVWLHLFNDPPRPLQIYEDDELDVFFPEHLDRAEINRARRRHPTEDLWLQRANTKYLGFDVTRPPFADVSVRRALALSTDRTALSGAGSCACFPATGGVVPAGIPGHQPDIARPFDPQAGRQLLAEAGYPSGRGFPEVTLLHSLGNEQLCIDLQAQWEENLGIEIRREASEWAASLQRMRAGTERPHMFALGSVAFVPDPAAHLTYGAFRQRTGWRQTEYDRLVDEALCLTNPVK